MLCTELLFQAVQTIKDLHQRPTLNAENNGYTCVPRASFDSFFDIVVDTKAKVDTIQTEIIALQLVSHEPLTVTDVQGFGFELGPHTDLGTITTEIIALQLVSHEPVTVADIEALGFVQGPHTAPPTTADIEALGFAQGPHTPAPGDVNALTLRVDDLEARLAALEAGGGPAGTCDQNEDGTIDGEELSAYLGPGGGGLAAAQSIIDIAETIAPNSNGNGIIDTFPELAVLNFLFETLVEPPPEGLGLVVEPCVVDALVPICNPNSDGTITPEEFAPFLTAISGFETTPEEAEAQIRSFESTVLSNSGDTNENGEIDTADELSEINTFLESIGLSCILGGP